MNVILCSHNITHFTMINISVGEITNNLSSVLSLLVLGSCEGLYHKTFLLVILEYVQHPNGVVNNSQVFSPPLIRMLARRGMCIVSGS